MNVFVIDAIMSSYIVFYLLIPRKSCLKMVGSIELGPRDEKDAICVKQEFQYEFW